MAEESCLFCKIVNGEIPSDKVYEDEDIYAFRDIAPVAPEHILIIPKKHIASLLELIPEEDEQLSGKMLLAAQKIARELGLEKDGFRLVNNIGEHGGQAVFHIHFHLLGGRQLSWPPG